MPHPAKAYLKKLKQAYRNRNLVPFVGAGVSSPLKMPGWGKLIDIICDDFDYEILSERKIEIEKLINNGEYLDAVDIIKESGIPEADLKAEISDLIYENKEKETSVLADNLYQDLADMNCTKYLTTNYDNYLSDYLEKAPQNLTRLYKEYINELDGPMHESAVYNLHGNYTKPSTIIISRESYDKLYRENEEFTRVLEHFRQKYTLLFIGFSLDDEYIQQVLKVGNKLRARHYILLSDVAKERIKTLEKKYDVRIIKYTVKNNEHTPAIRKILNEIKHVSKEKEDKSSFLKFKTEDNNYESQNNSQTRAKVLPLNNKNRSFVLKDSQIYAEIQEIKKLQEDGHIDKAITEYNKILQENLLDQITVEERALIIKELLANYTLIRDYSSAKNLINNADKLPKNRKNIDLLSFIIDFYFNTNDYKKAFKTAQKWYQNIPNDPVVYSLKIYTEAVYNDKKYNYIVDKLIDKNHKIIIDTGDDNERQFIYRLTGEIALYYNNYNDAVDLLRKAYEIDENIYNIEDLAIASYFKAIEKADDGSKIKIDDINFVGLNKAVEYFEVAFSSAKANIIRGVYFRTASFYLRSLFYLRKTMKFDQIYDQLIKYCTEDLTEVQRLKAINDLYLNKIDMDLIDKLNEIDRALILAEYYSKQKMHEKAFKKIKPLVDKYIDEKENIILQSLLILFVSKNKRSFNKYFSKYQNYWSDSANMLLMKSYYHEINAEDDRAEEILLGIIRDSKTFMNYNYLFSFYRRTGQKQKTEDLYIIILENETEVIKQNPEGFYSAYHEYLLSTSNMERAYWLLNKAKNVIPDSDILKFMEVEIKIKLLDFTDLADLTIDIYEKYKDYGETIFAYYAAVTYLHYNEFEESRYYLNLYKKNGNVAQKSIQSVKQLEDKLDLLQKHREPVQAQAANYIRWFALKTIDNSQLIRIPKNEVLIIDVPSLYIIFHLKKQNWLLDNPNIFLTFTTVDKLQRVYCATGDPVIYQIIDFISKKENIYFTAPTVEDSLYNRKTYRPEDFDFYDSLSLALQTENAFVTSYFLPVGMQKEKPVFLPKGFKTIKTNNGRIEIYTG